MSPHAHLKPTTFYIVRHGQTDWNAQGIIQGHKNSHLTEEGIEQAKALAHEFRNVPFSAIYSSDLSRAHQTAEIVAEAHQLPVITNPKLRERSSGVLEGRHRDVVRKELNHLYLARTQMSDQERHVHRMVKGMESDEDVVRRFIDFLHEATAMHRGERVLIVTHGALMRIFLFYLEFARHSQLPSGIVSNTGYMVVSTDGKQYQVLETKGIELLPE